MAVSYLNRLNVLFYAANEQAMGLNAAGWFMILLSLYRELSTEMQEEEKIECEKRIQHLNVLVANWNRNNAGTVEIPMELYKQLHDFELRIRQVVKKAGLQGRTTGDPGTALR